tara:strand:+ start:256 stop:411 length:156 start_codon:yes stop_codon:yes gene_type:complete
MTELIKVTLREAIEKLGLEGLEAQLEARSKAFGITLDRITELFEEVKKELP